MAGNVRKQRVYLRGPISEARQDGQGGLYETATTSHAFQQTLLHNLAESWDERSAGWGPLQSWHPLLVDLLPTQLNSRSEAMLYWEAMFKEANTFDDAIFAKLRPSLPKDMVFCNGDELEHRARAAYHLRISHEEDRYAKADPLPTALALLRGSAKSLKSLNLDWLIIRRTDEPLTQVNLLILRTVLSDIFELRFPALRAFQLRNVVVPECELPPDMYLLQSYDDATRCRHSAFSFESAFRKQSYNKVAY